MIQHFKHVVWPSIKQNFWPWMGVAALMSIIFWQEVVLRA